jgi:hypothetical protein
MSSGKKHGKGLLDPNEEEFELSQTFVGYNAGSNKDKFDSSKEFDESMTPQ